jgi:hypothetical protein
MKQLPLLQPNSGFSNSEQVLAKLSKQKSDGVKPLRRHHLFFPSRS